MNTLFLELLKLAIVGLVAGLFSSYLANRDYRQRKWWELRVAAYQDAIGSLSDLVYYYEKNFNAEMEGRDLFQDSKEKLEKYWEVSFPKVRKLADSGAFLFSPEANIALREFMKDDDAQSYWEHLENQLARAKKCLSHLVECSKSDLKLKPSVMDRLF